MGEVPILFHVGPREASKVKGEVMTKLFKFFLVSAGALVLMACDPPAADQTIVVNTTTDTADLTPGDNICLDGNGQCSLRAAVMEANANPNSTEIRLQAGTTYTLTIQGGGEDAAARGDLDLTERTYIRSFPVGQPNATIDANGLDRAIHVLDGDFHYLERLNIVGGDPFGGNNVGDGGAIFHRSGLLGIEDTHITGNNAGSRGGAIASWGGTLWIEDSTISNNTATTTGKAIYLGIGGYARLFQTTIADHPESGAAVHVETALNPQPTDILWSTITDPDTALDIGWGRTNVAHTIIEAPTNCNLGPNSTHTSQFSVYSDGSCPLGFGDFDNQPLRLTSLAGYSGPVPTRHPTVGSPAIDNAFVGDGLCTTDLAPDARGVDRPTAATLCDAGAVETIPYFTPGRDCEAPVSLISDAELRWCNLTGSNLARANILNGDLSYANLSQLELEDGIFTNADFTGANLAETYGRGIDFTRATFVGADLTYADYTGPDFERANFTNADLSFAEMNNSVFNYAILPNATLANATLPGANFSRAVLRGSDLTGTDLSGATLREADLANANLSGANLTNASLLYSNFSATAIDNVVWENTICPNGNNSNLYSPQTCVNDLRG